LSDNVSLALIPSNSPFLFDLNTLLPANSGLTVPEGNPTPETTPEPPAGG